MKKTLTSRFKVALWDEKPYREANGFKFTHSHVAYTYSGVIEGTSKLEYLMVYTPAAHTSFIGLEEFIGTIDGKQGTFVWQHTGTDNGEGTNGTFFVVPGSGTGELKHLRGEGHIALNGHAEDYPVEFTYWFEPEGI